MSTTLNWSSFEPLFGSWADKFKPFFLSGGFDNTYERLKFDSARGKNIAPLPSNVFRCFKETPIDNVRAVLLGYCPYHTFTGWTNRFLPGNNVEKESRIVPVADGLCLSCGITKRLQPSLIKWYDEIDRIYETTCYREPDLSFLAKQGLLMLNASLSVEEGKPGSHATLWEPFMKFLFEDVLITNGIPVVFLGKICPV